MVTITDQPEIEYGFPSFEDFLLRRAAMRQSAARDLASVQARKHADAQKLKDSYAHQFEQLNNARVSFADRARLGAELLIQKRKDLKAANASHDVEIAEIRRRYGLERSPKAQEASDFRDYMHAAKAHSEDVELAERHGLPDPGFDPVLVNLPQVRRRRDNGWMVYETPEIHGLAGQRELLRCSNREIIVRGADDDRVRAALLVASERYAPPLRLAGSDKFMARARAIAADLGIAVSEGAEQKNDSTPEKARATENPEPHAEAHEADAASQDDSTPDVVAARSKQDADLDFSVDSGDLKKWAADFGKSFVVPATSDKIKGTVLAWFASDVWNHSGALLVGCNERTAVIVPTPETQRPDLQIGDELELTRSDDGRYAIRNLGREAEPSVDSTPEVEGEQTPETPAESPELVASRGGGARRR